MCSYSINNLSSLFNRVSDCVPKEASTACLGIAVGAISNLGIQFVSSGYYNLPNIARNFVNYTCFAGAIAGIVVAVYSAVRLCQVLTSEPTELRKAITVTTLGGLAAALAQTIGQYFWEIAPHFLFLEGHSVAYCVATNLAWQASAITGLAGFVFTGYAAYRAGQAVIAALNPPAHSV